MSTMWLLVSFANYNSRAAVVAQFLLLHSNVGQLLGYGENKYYPEHQTYICGIRNSYFLLSLVCYNLSGDI